MKEKKNYNQVGFTLIEIIVTMAIIVVVFSIAVSRSNRMSSRSNVTLTSEVMVSDLRSTAMSALSSEQFQLQSPTGWGIQIESNTTPSSYTVFADLNGDRAYSTNEKLKTVILAKDVKLLCTSFNSECQVTGALIFNVPSAKTYFMNTEVTYGTGDVVVQLVDNVTGDTKNISINPLGTVSSE